MMKNIGTGLSGRIMRIFTLTASVTWGTGRLPRTLTQETFLRFLRNVERYREYGKIKNYLYVIAGNVIRDHYRKPREIPVERDLGAEGEPMPDSDMVYAAERVEIREALVALESPDREIVLLRYYQDLKIKDIGSRDGHAGVYGALSSENS